MAVIHVCSFLIKKQIEGVSIVDRLAIGTLGICGVFGVFTWRISINRMISNFYLFKNIHLQEWGKSFSKESL